MTATTPTQVSATARGFTLLELMVVVVIIGVITTLAVLSLGDNAARTLEKEAHRFASLIKLAGDEAILQGREIGLEINRDGYAFYSFDDQLRHWIPLSAGVVYRARSLASGMTLDLRLDDQGLPLLTAAEEEDGEDRPEPQVLLLSSGEMTPFELIFEIDDIDRQVVLTATANGVVETFSNNDR